MQVIKRPIIASHHLESICLFIGETGDGLTGTEIGKILADCHIQDTDPGITKWKRLYNAFTRSQKKHQCSNQVLQFLTAAMQPSRYFGKQEFFITRLNELNKRLSFIGISMTESAKFLIVEKAQTLSEAQQRASHFRYKLEIRNVHSDVFKYCGEELLQENFFHAVFEGVKSIADRLRGMTGIYADGNALIDIAFSTTTPLVRINLLQNETERSEHVGLSNMIKGLFGLIRNPTAHRPKIKFIIEEEEALDIMTLISFTHKKLDKAL